VAIVGASGAGKSTLLALLAGLDSPTSGKVWLAGEDLTTLDEDGRAALRAQRVGFVFQSFHLVPALTAIENVMLPLELDGVPARAARSQAIDALHGVGLDHHLDRFPDDFSGGQQQRIAIARAVYHRPPVLLFDEATSSLDTESERAVKENVDELLEGRTSFVIAHRLSTIRDADLIVVLERGRLVEQGTHDELMERRGLYYYLLSQQLDV
jgi:ABC-type multidrug transport system fused ATPase/permease subunit